MIFEWLAGLLPRGTYSSRHGVLWLLFFFLFPVAYFAGSWLAIKEESPARVQGALDRDMSIRAAEKFAQSKGVHVAGWNRFVVVETHEDLMAYYQANTDPDIAACSNLAPWREVTVLFRSPKGQGEFRTYLSLTGEVTGFDMGEIAFDEEAKVQLGPVQFTNNGKSAKGDSEGANLSKEDRVKTVPIAKSALEANPVLNRLIKLGDPGDISADQHDPMRTDILWEQAPAGGKGITYKISTSVRDAKVVAEHITARLNGDETSKVRTTPRFSSWMNSIYGVFLTFSAVYGLIRYAKRTLQKEVSHLRTIVVAALFCLSYTIFVYSLGVDQLAVRVSAARFSTMMLPVVVLGVLSCSVIGLMVGIGYGSGEGEVREAFPGKLTSLDALLAGRLFSRNVAASILFGVAVAGWLMFVQHGASYFVKPDMVAEGDAGLRYTFARLPWLTLLAGRQYESLLIAVAGLVLPAAFLVRSKTRGKRRYVWLFLFAVCAVLHEAAGYATAASALLAVGILVAGLLLPFFAFDLLAAMVSLSALAFVNELMRLSAIFPSWIEFALWLGAVGAATVALSVYLTFKGQSVRDEEVRPLYAKNLAERLGLQAEVSAAREAQLRLMPQVTPEVPGLEFGACCLPAKVVGGDFYDFFPLDAGRVGIFVAQGGEGGLASALCVALAKGVLMHTCQQTLSASQVVLRLESELARLPKSENNGQILYGVLDGRRQMLTFARVGDSPRVLIYRANGGMLEPGPLERLALLPGRPIDALPIHEGSVSLGVRDHLVFFTEGVTEIRRKRFGFRRNQWVESLMQGLTRVNGPMQPALAEFLRKYSSKVNRDLTAVVVRAAGYQAQEHEGVA